MTGYLVQKRFRCTETGADAGVAGFASTNAARCRVLETAVDFGIDEGNLGDVVELALPIVSGAACVGGVVAVPAGHLTDSATINKRVSNYMERRLIRALMMGVS